MDPESNTQTLAPSNNDQPQSEQGLATITKDEVLEVVNMHKRFACRHLYQGLK